MKRPLFKLIIITVLLSSLFTIKSNAQEIKLGGGLIIGTVFVLCNQIKLVKLK